MESAVWNLASFLRCASESRWQRFGQFFNDLLTPAAGWIFGPLSQSSIHQSHLKNQIFLRS
jgi:hypothetical protein